MQDKYVICKYIRLSIEDAKNDSLSVVNQRLLLDKHIESMGIGNAAVMEFVDNGHSGMNFERPAVQELFELVRQGEVNCIIVKDISRLGRNMIETGYYVERIFPLHRVRFISVSDYHDSADFEGDTGGMEIAFKFLVNEQYSRDLSRKIKSAHREKAARGEYITSNCVFGYKKAGNRLEVDEPAARTVRYIFDMAADGLSLKKIVSRLYAEKIPTPTESKKNLAAADVSCIWSESVIRGILSEEQYIGTYISGKSETIEVGSNRSVSVDKSKWIKIPDRHPPIIGKTLFNAVQEKRRQMDRNHNGTPAGRKHQKLKRVSPLKGKVVCGCCNHVMNLDSRSGAKFRCLFTYAISDMECYRHNVSMDSLEKVVTELVKSRANDILSNADRTAEPLGDGKDPALSIERIEDAKRDLYERFILGEIDLGEYDIEKAEMDIALSKSKSDHARYTKDTERKASAGKVYQLAKETVSTDEISQPVVDALIDRVRVYPDGRIEIDWSSTVNTINSAAET